MYRGSQKSMTGTSVPPPQASQTGSQYQIASVRSAFDLLFAFLQTGGNGGEFGVSDLARRTGQTKNQTFRLLQTLVAEGIVTQNPSTRGYALGIRLIELGAAAQSRSVLAIVARPILDAMTITAGERITIGQLTSDFSTVLLDSREVGPRPRDRYPAGTRFALHAGAGTKLLLAFSGPDYLDEYIRAASPLRRVTRFTLTQPSQLREECERIRQNGYSISCRDLDPDLCSVAVPVRDQSGGVLASVSISSPADQFGDDVRSRSLDRLLQAADAISARIAERLPDARPPAPNLPAKTS